MMKEDSTSSPRQEQALSTRISGKQWAARITTAVTAGSLATAGVAAVAVDMATTSRADATTSITQQDGGSSQDQAPQQDSGDSDSGPDSGSGSIAVQPGNGGTVNGHSSGS